MGNSCLKPENSSKTKQKTKLKHSLKVSMKDDPKKVSSSQPTLKNIDQTFENSLYKKPNNPTINGTHSMTHIADREDDLPENNMPLYIQILIEKSIIDESIFDNDDSSSDKLMNTFIFRGISIALAILIKNSSEISTNQNEEHMIFNETYRSINISDPNDDNIVESQCLHDKIFNFISSIFNNVKLTGETAVITLIYFERILMIGLVKLDSLTWKRTLLGSILMASKIWDDHAVWNEDFCSVLQTKKIKDLNELESTCLNLIGFNTTISSDTFNQYLMCIEWTSKHSLKLFEFLS